MRTTGRITLFTIISLFSLVASAQTPAAKPDRPKLIVGIVVDQMRTDYISRYWDKYGAGGFRRLVNAGFFCRNATYNYVPTDTGPGHTAIYTGSVPSVHGIITNYWFDRKSNKMVYCTGDSTFSTIGSSSKAGLMSPKRLLTTTITDELRVWSNMQSKVFGIALKDRGAILPAGHTGKAYWFDDAIGGWVTSSYYYDQLPAWVETLNQTKPTEKYFAAPWNTLLPIDKYTESTSDDNNYEGLFKGETKPVFPHNLTEIGKAEGIGAIRYTPFGNTLTKDFAIETIKNENLGKGKATDFLAVSFSSTDYVGHKYGPRSIEVEDTYLRLDKDIEELLNYLEKQVGKDNLLVFLTADHGAANNYQYMLDNKMPAGFYKPEEVEKELKTFLQKQYGPGEWITHFGTEQIFLNRPLIMDRMLDLDKFQAKVAEFMMTVEGVTNAYTETIFRKSLYAEGMARLIRNGFNFKRSGDVAVVLEPSWYEQFEKGTTHGTGYSYDTHIPILWYGWNVKQGSTVEPVEITDISPTIAVMLGLPFPNGNIGKPIKQLFPAGQGR